MSFIRSKEIPPHSGNWYDYEVETKHENGKVRQHVIRYIGVSSKNGRVSKPSKPRAYTPKKETPTNTHPVICKHCQSNNVRKYGMYKGNQYYFCSNCKRKFANPENESKKHYLPKVYEMARELIQAGGSYSTVCSMINNKFGFKPSRGAIYKWIHEKKQV
jgi:YHS domain-containing protein